jgi:hypothetical protein
MLEPQQSPGAPGHSGSEMRSEVSADPLPAWELIEAGRYQPRRIRGSLLGRALG